MKEILSLIENESHSRMPVFENNLDNVLGFLHVKDLIKNNNENSDNYFDITSYLEPREIKRNDRFIQYCWNINVRIFSSKI